MTIAQNISSALFSNHFPTGNFGEHHPRKEKLSPSEYVKSCLLNNDSRFRKDSQYVFYLLWQKELREINAGIYNLLKGSRQQTMPVKHFISKIDRSNSDVDANLSTMFQTVRGSKQYWFQRHSELLCMLQEYGSPTFFLTLSCAEYENDDISRYPHKVNDVRDTYPTSKLCTEDPISVSRKFSQLFFNFFDNVIIKGKVLGTVSL